MGYAVIMFVIMLLLAVSIALSSNYGISKYSQEAPLLAENVYADREGGKMQTDLVIVATKINGTATYTYPEHKGDLNTLNLYLTIKNNGSINLDPREYSILLNRSWVWLNKTSNNLTTPLNYSDTSSLNLSVTSPSMPMSTLSLVVTTSNGVRIITPTSPIMLDDNATVFDISANGSWWDAKITWIPSYGEMWPISYYTVYWTNSSVPSDIIDKNNFNIATRTSDSTNYIIGQFFPKGGTPVIYLFVTATDTHGNEGPPSNTCTAQGSGLGTRWCNYHKQ